jgi:enoyl-[acyl-carrier protein] reductase/trans-2-enoyl-CoA reductase (NAD+)
MIIKPKVRSFMCVTAHPEGCAKEVENQIALVKKNGKINGPKRVLVIGSSTGYGLSTRIVAAFGCGAETLGVMFERPSTNGKTASPGWYNTAAFEKAAIAEGLKAKTINGDAFSDEIKAQVIDEIKNGMGQVDLVIYSLASPRRTDPETGEVYKATLKPVGEKFSSITLDTDRKEIQNVEIEPATDEDVLNTQKVMGGEDWVRWIDQLKAAGVLAEGVRTVAYSYIGPDVTWPIYRNGTIGKAKEHLEQSARSITEALGSLKGDAYIAVNKAVVTQASSAIPVVPLYISLLFKIMKADGSHEGCIEQMDRLFRTCLYHGGSVPLDEVGRIRVDDWEMREDIQKAVAELWPKVTSENLIEISDFTGYQQEFLRLFGFEQEGVNYDLEVEEVVPIPSIG